MKIRNRIILALSILWLALFAAVHPAASEGEFTIVVLPDTQFYTDTYANLDIFNTQTEWIVANKDDLNIAFVAHVGDVVNNNSSSEYIIADAAMDLLDSGNVPYGTSPGNHDGSIYDTYFGTSRYSAKPFYGGSSGQNTYFLFSAGGMDFIIVFLSWTPDASELEWANARLQQYSSRRGIVVSHGILGVSGNWSTHVGANGEQIFNALKGNANLFLMLCGHEHGEARRTDTGTSGNSIHSVLADYQSDTNGGNGKLRIMEFDPAANQINVTTYSPYTGAYYGTAFALDYDMTEPSGAYLATSPNSLASFATQPGIPSAEKTYTVSGGNLSDNVTVTAPADFEVSLASGSGFGPQIVLTPTAGALPATTVYTRFNRATAGSSSGSIAHTSLGADTRNVSVSGTASPPAPSGWKAYNDCVYDSTKALSATDDNGQLVHYIGANVTTFGIGSGFSGSSSGVLLDQATGLPTGVTATLMQNGGVNWQSDVSSNWYGGYDTASDTDARTTFGGIADMTGVIYYGSSSGWWVDVTFTGLNPEKRYRFATSSARCNSTYTDRITKYTISGADAFTSAGTPGVTVTGGGSEISFNTGDNHATGYVARWEDIAPGADGSFAVRAQAGSTVNQAYAFDVFLLEEMAAGTCPGDFDTDGDVDGTDLYKRSAGLENLDLGVFAENFGKDDCL